MEAPISRPYDFCEMVKQSKGPEKKIMDFKTGKSSLMQAQPHYHSSSRKASLWQSTREQAWDTIFRVRL